MADKQAEIEATLKLCSVKNFHDFARLLRFLEEHRLILLSRKGTRTSGRRRAYMFDKHPTTPNKVTYLYDDGETRGECLVKNLSRVFTIAEPYDEDATYRFEYEPFEK